MQPAGPTAGRRGVAEAQQECRPSRRRFPGRSRRNSSPSPLSLSRSRGLDQAGVAMLQGVLEHEQGHHRLRRQPLAPSVPARPAAWPGRRRGPSSRIPSGAKTRQRPEALSTSCFALAAKTRPVPATRRSQIGAYARSARRARRSAADNSSEAGREPLVHRLASGGVEADLGQERPSHAEVRRTSGRRRGRSGGPATRAGRRRRSSG